MFFNNSIISIDIGSKFIKAIDGYIKNNDIIIKNHGITNTHRSPYAGYNMEDKNDVANALAGLLKSMNVKTKYAVFGVRGSDIIVRHTEIPEMPEKQLKQAASIEIQQYLQMDKDQYVYDSIKIGKSNPEGKNLQNVLMVAVPKEKINFFFYIADKLKLEVRGIDLYASSIAKLFPAMTETEHEDSCIAVMDIGYELSTIVLIENGRLFFEKDIGIGVKDIHATVAKAFAALPEKVEAIRGRTINLSAIDDSVSTADPRIYFANNSVRQVVDSLMDETAKVINFYLSEGFGKSISHIYLYGGGARIEGMLEYIMSFTGIETKIISTDIFPQINKVDQELKNNIDLYVNCISLLMRKD